MTTRSRYTAAITDKPWWLAGGVEPGICVAAYQAVGAESYEMSKINLAHPGLFTLAENTTVSWAKATGWDFNGSEYFATGIYPTVNYSIVAYISTPGINRYAFGSSLIGEIAVGAGSRCAIDINGTITRVDPGYLGVVWYSKPYCALFTKNSYKAVVNTGTFAGADPNDILIGGHYAAGEPAALSTGWFYAIAIYNGCVTEQQCSHIAARLFQLF